MMQWTPVSLSLRVGIDLPLRHHFTLDKASPFAPTDIVVSSLRCRNCVEKVTYFIDMPHSSAWCWPSWCSAGKTSCEIPACKLSPCWRVPEFSIGLNEIHDRVKSGKADKVREKTPNTPAPKRFSPLWVENRARSENSTHRTEN